MDGSPNGSTPLNANGKPFHKVHHFCLHTINNANNVIFSHSIQEECVKRERNVRKESSTTKETKYENDSKATENDRNEHKKKNTA